MALSIDLEKAYDRLEWSFIYKVLINKGFNKRTCNLIMSCVTSVSSVVLVNNGKPTEFFNPTRGLRQGDPLSPFLFLLTAETFNRLILKGREIGVFKGITIGTRQVSITHLQFADDTIIFSPANDDCINNYKKFLHCFSLENQLSSR